MTTAANRPLRGLSAAELQRRTREEGNVMANVEDMEKLVPDSARGFFGKLANGDFGLARTYWGLGYLSASP